ncbi:MAG: enolase C-terminal domain-like protein [Verrucomicrobiota bacterium]
MHRPTPKPFISRYRLKARGYLNAVSSRREFDGALIRVGDGFGCLHPWPELGEPTLEKCLADLAGEQRWQLVRRALRCAEYDAAARSNDDSLFEEMEVPPSHATLPKADIAEISRAVEAGFAIVKLKCGRALQQEAALLEAMVGEFPALRWRLDFNECLSPEVAAAFLTGLTESTRRAIDFVEDPCLFAESTWSELHRCTGLSLAVDLEATPQSAAAQVMIIKPAIDEPFLLAEAAISHNQRVVLTSRMDHPLGQAFAAWEAARLGLQFPGLPGVCGLQTHHLFEPDPFSEALGPWAPEFQPPGGTGLGFDDLLEALPWTRSF